MARGTHGIDGSVPEYRQAWKGSNSTCVLAWYGSRRCRYRLTILASLEYKNAELIDVHPVWMLITKGLLVIVLFAGNYLGGELLLKYVSRDFHG